MKDTIFNNDEYHTTASIMANPSNITIETIKQNIKTNHTRVVENYLNSQANHHHHHHHHQCLASVFPCTHGSDVSPKIFLLHKRERGREFHKVGAENDPRPMAVLML